MCVEWRESDLDCPRFIIVVCWLVVRRLLDTKIGGIKTTATHHQETVKLLLPSKARAR